MSIPAADLVPSDAERAVLGLLMTVPDAMQSVKDLLSIDDFQGAENRAVYAGMLSLHDQGKPVDLLLLRDVLGDDAGGIGYWSGLSTDALPLSPFHLQHYVEMVQETSQRVKLHRAIEQAQRTRDPLKAIEQLQASLVDVEGVRRRVDWDDREQSTQELITWVTTKPEPGERGLSTGLPTLDGYLNGLRRKHLVIIAARPGIGKTSMAVGFAYQVGYIQQRPVLFFSAEMSREEIRQKIACIAAGLAWERIDNHELSEIEERRLVKRIEEIGRAPIFVIECPDWTVSQIHRTARIVNTAVPLSLIETDYLQFLSADRKTDSRVQEVGSIARGLKRMAVELGPTVVAPTQLNRRSEYSGEPTLADMRESGEIEQTSNVVILLWKDKEEQEDAPPPVETIYCRVAKNRMGRKGKFALGFRGAQMEFVELERAHEAF